LLRRRERVRPNEISYKAIGAAMRVHTAPGVGLLESVYEKCLSNEFTRASLQFRRQVSLPIVYDGATIKPAYNVDFIVEGLVVVEIKCVERVLPMHRAQLLSYLKLTKLPLGLLLNFKVPHLRDGIVRVIDAPAVDL
jgi:GxxExxY protein